MAGYEELSQEQTELLVQFQDLTGIENFDVCREVLGRHNWDLEAAVQDQLNIREGRPTAYSSLPSSSASSNAAALVNHASDQWVFTSPNTQGSNSAASPGHLHAPPGQPTPIANSGGWIYFLLTFPFRLIFGSIFSVLGFLLRLVRPDNRRYLTDPVADVVSFIRWYEPNYGTVHPTFYQGTYSQALNDAKRELRFLLVYLHCQDHQDTMTFCSHVLTNPALVAFVNENALFWACSVTTPEGYRVSQALRENAYPFLALIVLRDNRMTVVGRIEGPMEVSSLIHQLEGMMRANESYLVAARAERNERSFNQSLREEQDLAYMESLKADQEKERRKQEEKAEQEREANKRRMEEEEVLRQKEAIRQKKIELASQIPEEPLSTNPDAVRILIKFPSGTRLERRFLRTQSLKMLYYYVFCHNEGPDKFEISTNYPKRVLPCIPSEDFPEPPSFIDAGLGNSETVFVYDLEA